MMKLDVPAFSFAHFKKMWITFDYLTTYPLVLQHNRVKAHGYWALARFCVLYNNDYF